MESKFQIIKSFQKLHWKKLNKYIDIKFDKYIGPNIYLNLRVIFQSKFDLNFI